jgi:heme exporter protein C
MRKVFVPILVLTAAMFAYSPIAIANAPYESTMLLVQKIFYYHFPTWIALTFAVTVCTVASAVYLFKGTPAADRLGFAAAEVTVVFGLFGLVSGSLWGRKAWGVWWQWDARLTMAFLLELIFFGYLVVRKYGGPGSDKLAAAMGIFGGATAPFVYKSVDWWRTIHPKTSVVQTLVPEMWYVILFCTVTFLLLCALLLAARVRLETLRAELDQRYLALED